MSTDTSAPPTLVQRVDGMLADIRADRVRRRELANPHRPNRMLAGVMGGDAQTIAELRTANGELAREVVALKEALWQACRTNATLAQEVAELKQTTTWGERLGFDDKPRGGAEAQSEGGA